MHLQTRSWGDYDFHPTAVYPSVVSAAQNSLKHWDYIVVTTKALPDRNDGAALIKPLVRSSSVIVLIQNGVGIEAPYRERYPMAPIVSGVAVMTAEQIKPGTVRQNLGTRLVLGPYTDAAAVPGPGPVPVASRRSQALCGQSVSLAQWQKSQEEDLTTRGTKATAQLATWLTAHGGIPDIDAQDERGLQIVRWHKVAINAALNPASVLSGGRSTGAMVSDEELRAHLVGVMREIWGAVPQILGLQDGQGQMMTMMTTKLPAPERVLSSVMRSPEARPSMLQDWEAGRPLEVEVILGNPVRLARARGVELPRTQSLYALVRSAQVMRNGKLGRDSSRL